MPFARSRGIPRAPTRRPARQAADRVDESMKSIKSRTAQLQRKSEDAKAKAEQAQMRYERYVGHVRRLEEEVVAAKGHVEAARKDLEEHQQEALHAEDTLDLLEELRHIDDGLNAEVSAPRSIGETVTPGGHCTRQPRAHVASQVIALLLSLIHI